MNKSLIEASGLPLSLKSEIISTLPFPCRLPMLLFFFNLKMEASWVSVKILIVFDSTADLIFIYLNNEMQCHPLRAHRLAGQHGE